METISKRSDGAKADGASGASRGNGCPPGRPPGGDGACESRLGASHRPDEDSFDSTFEEMNDPTSPRRPRGPTVGPPRSPRRSSALALAALAAAGIGAYSVLVEPRWLEVKEVDVPLARLPRALDGLRIAHLSDFHCGTLVSDDFLARSIRTATEADADLALVTGDYVTDSHDRVPGLTPLLSRLRARCGVYAILGNHDHYVCPESVAAAVASAGIQVLRNESRRLEIDGEPLWVVGIDSLRARQYRLSRAQQACIDGKMRGYLCQALDSVDDEGCRILMAHSPDIFPDAQRAGIDLVLSGHTHGGQVRLPVVGATVVPSKYGARYAAGLFVEGGTALYVNRGLGVVRLPIRFLCRPELSILTLRRA